MKVNKQLIFYIFLCLMIIDRVVNLLHFGFVYTDIDQTVMWNGACDYSKGIFHEPFFYGQPFNYMLESFLSMPLLWFHVPVYIALPLITSLISLLPFAVLAIFFMKRNQLFWSCLCLAFPVLLPVQYGFLTSLSRGFVQAHLFIPFLFIPLFYPENKRSVTILFIFSALSFIANQSSILISIPLALYAYTFHYSSRSFYLKSLLVIPFLIIDHFAKHYYDIHPDKIMHQMIGMSLDIQVFLSCFKNKSLFEYLFPFVSSWGFLYHFVFILLAIAAYVKLRKREFLFIITIPLLIFITFAVPKVQEIIENTGVFFTSSRFYLFLPILFIISLSFIIPNLGAKKVNVYMLLLISIGMLIFKNKNISEVAEATSKHTIFPVAKCSELVARAEELDAVVKKYNIDLIINSASSGWNYVFDSYAFNPIIQGTKEEKVISVDIQGDRRTWLYPASIQSKQILLHAIKMDTSLLNNFEFEKIKSDMVVIKNNKMNIKALLKKMKLEYGNEGL